MPAATSRITVDGEIEYLVVPQGVPDGDRISPDRTIKAVFDTAGEPADVTIRLFCVGDVIGVGVYPTDRNGVVLRWHDGPSEDARVIHWRAPESPGDVCR